MATQQAIGFTLIIVDKSKKVLFQKTYLGEDAAQEFTLTLFFCIIRYID